jgi:hypothetical protein
MHRSLIQEAGRSPCARAGRTGKFLIEGRFSPGEAPGHTEAAGPRMSSSGRELTSHIDTVLSPVMTMKEQLRR